MLHLFKFNNIFQYVSDLHLEKGFKRIIVPSKPFLLLCGDIGHPELSEYKNFLLHTSSLFDKVFILSGNHEYDNLSILETENTIREICYIKNNLFFLQKDTVLIEDNLYLAACTLWSPLPKSKTLLHLDHVKWLHSITDDKTKNYFIATHHCPLLQCINRKYHLKTFNYFASNQSDIINKSNVKLWLHGHSHKNSDFLNYNTWIISNQYGSFSNPSFGFKH
jgi:predicted phosphohydrolase